MRTMLALTAIAAATGLGGCDPKESPCPKLVVQGPTKVSIGEDQLMVMVTRDTLPKPYKTCVTLYANARDTLPKPR